MFIYYNSVLNSKCYKQIQKSALYSIHYFGLHTVNTAQVNLYVFFPLFIHVIYSDWFQRKIKQSQAIIQCKILISYIFLFFILWHFIAGCKSLSEEWLYSCF